jgi:hypothetical protein
VRLSLGSGAKFSLQFVRQLGMFALVAIAAIAVFAAPKVESTGPCTESGVPDSVRNVLAPSGYRVTLDDGLTASLWPTTQILTSSKAREDATYALAPSTFFGVIIFAKNTRDCRGNTISAGAYNLRYELYPNDGAHLGVTATPDFLLLVPTGADVNPAQTYSFEQVVGLSKQVTGKSHPAPMNLAPADATQFPSLVIDSEGHTILYIKVKTQSGELPVGLVVKAPTPE